MKIDEPDLDARREKLCTVLPPRVRGFLNPGEPSDERGTIAQ